MTLTACLLVGAALFCTGVYGLLSHNSVVGMLLSIELMANAANVNFVAFAHHHGGTLGQVFALVAIALTVAEVAIGLAIVVLLHRTHGEADSDLANEMKG